MFLTSSPPTSVTHTIAASDHDNAVTTSPYGCGQKTIRPNHFLDSYSVPHLETLLEEKSPRRMNFIAGSCAPRKGSADGSQGGMNKPTSSVLPGTEPAKKNQGSPRQKLDGRAWFSLKSPLPFFIRSSLLPSLSYVPHPPPLFSPHQS